MRLNNICKFFIPFAIYIANSFANADRFVENDPEGSSLPVWVGVYIVLGVVALAHERSPLKEWVEQNPLTAFVTFLAVPLLFLFQKLLAWVVLTVIALVFFSSFTGGKGSSSEEQGAHENDLSRQLQKYTNLPMHDLSDNLLADKFNSMDSVQPTTSWQYVDVCIYYAKNFDADYLMSKVQEFRTKIGLKYPEEFDPPEWMSLSSYQMTFLDNKKSMIFCSIT